MEIENQNNRPTLNKTNNNNNNNSNNNSNNNNNNNNIINKVQLNNKVGNKIVHKTMKSNNSNKIVVGLKSNKKSTKSKNVIINKNDISQNKLEQINESNELNNGNNDLNNEIKKLKEELKKVKEKNNLLSNENKILKKTIEEKDSEIKDLKKKNSLLQKDNDKIKLENKNLTANNKKLEKEKNESNETIEKIKKANPFILYESPTLVGLENIGGKCFINSTLQCLSQTKDLTKFFLNKKNENRIINNNIALENKNDKQLAPVYLELIQKLWEINGEKKYSPNKFNDTLYNINSIFQNAKTVGPKDLVVFILEQLHKELKKVINNDNTNNSQVINQYNEDSALNYFINDFKNNTSVISDIFFGVNETNTICLKCQNIYNQQGLNTPICYGFGNFYFLSFPLEEIKNMKLNKSFNQLTYFNVLTLNDCFFYNQKSEYFTGENQNFCNTCKLFYDSNFYSKIYVSPNVLILILDRGIENIRDIKIFFTETIDISQFVIQKDSPQLIYNLYGVVSEVNQNGLSQHFIASCKSPIDNKWYKYDDTVVTPISDVQREVIGFGNPYILFYQKNN